MITAITSVLYSLGVFFIFVASLGVLKLPDVYSRMHAASKASSLGMGLILIGAALEFGSIDAIVKCVLTLIFIFLTTPIAAHMLGRAAYLSGAKTWERTRIDELKEIHQERAENS